MAGSARQPTWPALAMISGGAILAIFAFRSLAPIAARVPVYDHQRKVIGLQPSPHYERFRDEQTALLIAGGTLLLGGVVGKILTRRREAEVASA